MLWVFTTTKQNGNANLKMNSQEKRPRTGNPNRNHPPPGYYKEERVAGKRETMITVHRIVKCRDCAVNFITRLRPQPQPPSQASPVHRNKHWHVTHEETTTRRWNVIKIIRQIYSHSSDEQEWTHQTQQWAIQQQQQQQPKEGNGGQISLGL